MTMATIINSDMIPFKQRGMYQALQNLLNGTGSICGASLGGLIADHIGWRWCFFCQVPVSIFAFIVGYFVIAKDKAGLHPDTEGAGLKKGRAMWEQIDLVGAVLLVLGLSAQLAALSMGGNIYSWSNSRVIVALAVSVALLVVFVVVELCTKAMPVMPMSMLKGTLAVSNLFSNVCLGMVAYSVRRGGLSALKGLANSLESSSSTSPFFSRSFFSTRPLKLEYDLSSRHWQLPQVLCCLGL